MKSPPGKSSNLAESGAYPHLSIIDGKWNRFDTHFKIQDHHYVKQINIVLLTLMMSSGSVHVAAIAELPL